MSIGHARVIKADGSASAPSATAARSETFARRVPALVVDARAEADRIMREAMTAADAIVADARDSALAIGEAATRAAREQEVARVLAELIALRVSEEQRAERELDRTVEIAALLAERVIGEAIAVEPARIAALAQSALRETRGARKMRIEACKDDVAALEAMLAGLADTIATVEVSADLLRGSLIVHTELGRIDAQLGPQLTRLAEALREALRDHSGGKNQRSSGE